MFRAALSIDNNVPLTEDLLAAIRELVCLELDEFNQKFFDELTITRLLSLVDKYSLSSEAFILPSVLRIIGQMVATANIGAAMEIFFK